MRQNGIGEVENYTDAFLCIAYLLLVMTLVMIWGVWGYVVSLSVCAGLHWAIKRLGLRRARMEAAWDARVAEALDRAYRR
ncbi:hypothetical protein [Jannaschia sp. 2305UL9-9]|uniref:hypothetical protein n=1 Tax=Jannaschia sp. 2305UL9-9 TaxID=3121638 RepID=UPI0035283344